MLPIVTPAQMQAIDAAAPESVDVLIERAAWHVARTARGMLGGVYGRRVVVIAGKGNNGNDARAAALLLSTWGVSVEIVAPDVAAVSVCDLVIDGAYGTGMNRAFEAPRIPSEVPVLSIDIPSGLDGLTGQVLGQAIRARRTVTFAALKPGLVLPGAISYVGSVDVVDIGLDTSVARAHLLTEADAVSLLPVKPPTVHKWDRAVWVIGGSQGMYGAPLMASQAAQRSGAGMVWCGLPGQQPPVIASEVVFSPLSHSWHDEVAQHVDRFGSLVVGCGLGRSPEAAASLKQVMTDTELPVVIDADGLRVLGSAADCAGYLRQNVVLTPHDGEYQSLMGEPPAVDRFAAARSLAECTGATVLLKGPLTIVASPDGQCVATSTADERLATAGTGDVLAGIIGSYLAAGLPPLQSAALGAWIHGAASQRTRRVGMVASDLLAAVADVSSELAPTTTRGGVRASD